MKLGKSPTTGIIAALVAGLLLGSIISASGNSALASAVGWIEPLGELWVNAIRMTVVPLVVALLIGGIALPGTFLARAFVERMPVHIHTAILDAAVIAGGLVMISAALRGLL